MEGADQPGRRLRDHVVLVIELADRDLQDFDLFEAISFQNGRQGGGALEVQGVDHEFHGRIPAQQTLDLLFHAGGSHHHGDSGNRQIRLYRPDEFTMNGRTPEEWMDFYVSQIELILENEPVDIYANPMFLPPELAKDADALWTDARIDRVIDKLAQHRIALEINSRYRIPSVKVLKKAKARGLKFAFGTNNVDANIGRLEWALDAARECGLEKGDMWFPTDSVRKSRKTVIYNRIKE